MKTLNLNNKSFLEILKDFENWLDILGFAPTTVYNLPNHLKEFFYYLERINVQKINCISTQIVKDYYDYLKSRDNKRKDGSLSDGYLNKHQQALFKFNDYLKAHNHKGINIHLKREKQSQKDSLEILTQDEIKQLFKATKHSHGLEKIAKRDAVILVLLYSCGLRRNEVINLKIKDILFDRERMFVKKGKNYKERFVPVNAYNLKIIEEYIYDYRPQFSNYKMTESLLVNSQGTGLHGQTLCNRLNEIIRISGNKKLINKAITPHTLRHSIATHLLEQGAKLETISQFLGHSSLESTQIYTHILEDKAKANQDEGLHNLLRNKRLQHQNYPNIPKSKTQVRFMDE